jgi:diaminopimelate epimerase
LNPSNWNRTGERMTTGYRFLKMHGAGNDFIMIDGRGSSIHLEREDIARLCDRRRGIGADGIIFVYDSDISDFKMDYYNKDGGQAELCGNGARCAARFAREIGIVGEVMSFETGAGIVNASVGDEDVSIKIGNVSNLMLYRETKKCGFKVHYAVAGVPHSLIIVDDVNGISKDTFLDKSRAVRYDPVFSPDGTNFNMVSVMEENFLEYRTYERGVEGETQSCGTGAVAVAVICCHLGLTGSETSCRTSGGDILEVKFEKTEYGAINCMLKGPAVISFEGFFKLNNFSN